MKKHPYFTTARFRSVCPETGRRIQPGETIAYFPATRQAFHAESKTAAELRAQEFADAWSMPDANW
jgi:hypothetical protein